MPNEPATSENKTLAKVDVSAGDRGIQLRSMDEMGRFCLAVCKSRLAPKGFETPEAIMVAVQYGMEIGLSPMQALQSIAVINGRPCVWGDALAAIMMGRADFEDLIEEVGETSATCTIKRKGRSPVVRTFTQADAKKAGLWGKGGPWTQYPTRMLQMRARAWAIRDAFPDALKGVQVREEVRDYPREEKPLTKAKLIVGDEPEQLCARESGSCEQPRNENSPQSGGDSGTTPPQPESFAPADQDGADENGEFSWK